MSAPQAEPKATKKAAASYDPRIVLVKPSIAMLCAQVRIRLSFSFKVCRMKQDHLPRQAQDEREAS
jgi:hypothetical protein|eukprot:COSAG06_NODE_4190_length_4491_cov_1.526412_2_plen_66_part_00